MHVVILAELHVNVDVAPEVITRGFAEKVSVGAGAGITVTVVVPKTDPAGPVHVKPKLVVVAGETLCEPEVALEPLQPPEAVHESVLPEVHESTDDCPAVIDAGEAEI